MYLGGPRRVSESVDWLYWAQASGPAFGSVTVAGLIYKTDKQEKNQLNFTHIGDHKMMLRE